MNLKLSKSYIQNFNKLTWTFALLLLLIVGCSSSSEIRVQTGGVQLLEEGKPSFIVQQSVLPTEDRKSKIRIHGELNLNSLITSSDGDQNFGFSANVQIYNHRKNSDSDPSELVFSETLERKFEAGIDRAVPYRFSIDADIEPGRHTIYIVVQDAVSNSRGILEISSLVPDRGNQKGDLSHISISGGSLSSESILTYHLPKDEKLTADYNVAHYNEVKIIRRLMLFQADQEPARLMSSPNYGRSSIQWRGIRYNRYEIIETDTLFFEESGVSSISQSLPQLESGNYRLEISVWARTDSDWRQETFRARDFSFFTGSFPSVHSLEDLIGPMVYLMSDREFEQLTQLEGAEQRRAFDEFWLENTGSSERARETIAELAKRVEQANKQFTTYKEGWKTDMGMLYILLGEPWYVVRVRPDVIQWLYNYNYTDPQRVYTFDKTRMEQDEYPFENFVLRRNQFYHTFQYKTIQDWRSGHILQRL